jgi:hypothetical protein
VVDIVLGRGLLGRVTPRAGIVLLGAAAEDVITRVAGWTTPSAPRQSEPSARLLKRPSGMAPGFEAPLPEMRSPSISKPWTVLASRPLAARMAPGRESATPYCRRMPMRKRAIHRKTQLRLRRVGNTAREIMSISLQVPSCWIG